MKLSRLLSLLAVAYGVTFLAGQRVEAQAAPKNIFCLFTQANFKGAHFCFRAGQRPPSLAAFPLSDGTYSNGQFGSLLIDGAVSADIFDSENYGTTDVAPMHITSSIPDLSTAWTAPIYSIDVE